MYSTPSLLDDMTDNPTDRYQKKRMLRKPVARAKLRPEKPLTGMALAKCESDARRALSGLPNLLVIIRN